MSKLFGVGMVMAFPPWGVLLLQVGPKVGFAALAVQVAGLIMMLLERKK